MMSKLTNGIKEVEINGEDYTLKVTVAAIEAIENRYGSITGAAQACMKINLQDSAFIISHAASLNKEQSKKLKQHLSKVGMEQAAVIATDYLGMVLNPNGEPDDEDEDESGED